MRIDVWSDVVCPWCYLGWQRLNAALEITGSDGVDVQWHAYELDPNAPVTARPLKPVIEKKYGPGAFEEMVKRFAQLGNDAGLDYRLEDAKRINTRRAHRLLAWASDIGLESATHERLFRGYFTLSEDFSDEDVLLDAIVEAGGEREAAHAALESEVFDQRVEADQQAARDRGITGVPAFVINDEFLIPGAQEVDQFVRIIERIRAREQ